MKKFFLLTILTTCLLGCSSREDKIKTLIKEYVKENLKEPSSYEPLSFSVLDSTFTSYFSTEEGKMLYDLGSYFGEYYKKYDKFDSLSFAAFKKPHSFDKYLSLKDSAKYYRKKYEDAYMLYKENEKNFKGEFNGWRVTHKYRAKNGFGILDFENMEFFFDKEVTKIVKSGSLD